MFFGLIAVHVLWRGLYIKFKNEINDLVSLLISEMISIFYNKIIIDDDRQ